MKKKIISVMIPTYNEEENARPIYEAVKNEIETNLPEYDYEILFIDNKSQDNTRKVIEGICAEDKNVRAIFNAKNFGQFNSPYYGLCHTSGDCTISLCADFQDPVNTIPRLVHKWEEGYKIVCAIKTKSKENPLIYFLRGCYYKFIHEVSSVSMIEQFTGFGLYDRSFTYSHRGYLVCIHFDVALSNCFVFFDGWMLREVLGKQGVDWRSQIYVPFYYNIDIYLCGMICKRKHPVVLRRYY